MGVCTLVLCSLATVTSCIDPYVRIVTKSPEDGNLYLYSISLAGPDPAGDGDPALHGGQDPLHAHRTDAGEERQRGHGGL